MVISMDLRFREIDPVLRVFKNLKKLTLLKKAHHTSLERSIISTSEFRIEKQIWWGSVGNLYIDQQIKLHNQYTHPN